MVRHFMPVALDFGVEACGALGIEALVAGGGLLAFRRSARS
jgi:hypothetical protein